MTSRSPTLDEGPAAADPAPAEAGRRGLPLVAKIAIGVFLAASALMWSYGLFGPRSDPPGTMDDPAFGRAAESVCAPVVARIDDLPVAHETPEPAARADVIDQANALLATQLDDLDDLAAGAQLDSRDRGMVSEWLADWRTYLGDRESYADALREDADARLLETPKEDRPISFVLTQFALKNDMASCAPPGDVG